MRWSDPAHQMAGLLQLFGSAETTGTSYMSAAAKGHAMPANIAATLLSNRSDPAREAAYVEMKRNERRRLGVTVLILLVITGTSAWISEVNLGVFFAHIGNFTSYFDRLLTLDSGTRVWTNVPEWFWGLSKWLRLLFETVLMAWLGTALGALVAFFASFLASANLIRSRVVRLSVRRTLELLRTIPELVYALVFVASFGLGPLAGVLALMLHTVGALGKLYSEIIENIDLKPVEGLTSAGANFVQTCRFGVVPQIMSGVLSYALLRFEINVRAAAVLGYVGAGGIGDEFYSAIRRSYYSDVSAILVIIIVAVMLIDTASGQLRRLFLSREFAA